MVNCTVQVHNERGQVGHYSPPNEFGGAKSPNNIASTFFNTMHCFRKTLGSNMGLPNVFLAQDAI